MTDVKRGPGRPSKKGNSSWKPASVTEVTNKEDGYRYRWSNKTPDNLAKKQLEGWETVSAIKGDNSEAPEPRINDGTSLTSVNEKHDVILQRIPEELAQERDGYFENVNKRRVEGLTAHIKDDLKKEGANAHGEITISSRKGN